jgi:toxin ParE1/3/4
MEIYESQLTDAITHLARFPEMGLPVDEYGKGLRKFPIEQHVVFYVNNEDTIEIARILHRPMDPASHF